MMGRMRVALMVTCVNDAMFPDTGRAVVDLLTRLGVDVEFPRAQTCCAQPMVNTGYLDEAVPVVRTFVDAFAGFDAVVTPSGSCAASARPSRIASPTTRPVTRSGCSVWATVLAGSSKQCVGSPSWTSPRPRSAAASVAPLR